MNHHPISRPLSAGDRWNPARRCADLLETTGVALTPGADFDRVAGGRSVRVSLAAGADAVAAAVERIIAFQERGG